MLKLTSGFCSAHQITPASVGTMGGGSAAPQAKTSKQCLLLVGSSPSKGYKHYDHKGLSLGNLRTRDCSQVEGIEDPEIKIEI